MARELGHLGIDIAALSETRLSDEGQLEEIGGGYTFFWKGLPAGERRDYGIGFAIKTSLTRQLVELPVGISERLMTLRLHLQQQRYATIISAYAPTLVADEADKAAFYSLLDETLQRIPATDKIILLGDFNARVGRDHTLWNGAIGRHGIGSCNANGESLLNLCNSHDLVITNTVFQQSNCYRTSWRHPRSKH